MTVLTIVAGSPWHYDIVIKDGKNIWATLAAFEVRAQLRATVSTSGYLISNLHDFMVKDYNDNDIVIDWSMTGAQTRALYALRWGRNKTGYVNIVISDPGEDDAHALVFPPFQMVCKDTTTTGSGVS